MELKTDFEFMYMSIHMIDIDKHIAYKAWLEVTSQTKFDFHKLIADLRDRISVLRNKMNNKFKVRKWIGTKLAKVVVYLESKRLKLKNK